MGVLPVSLRSGGSRTQGRQGYLWMIFEEAMWLNNMFFVDRAPCPSFLHFFLRGFICYFCKFIHSTNQNKSLAQLIQVEGDWEFVGRNVL